MRKLIIFILPFILFGCSNKLNISGNITEIKYNNVLISKNDFNKIKKMINTVYDKKSDKDLSNKLTIKTTKDIYYFSLNDNNIKYGEKVAQNDKLNTYLQHLTQKYTDKSFYKIDYMKNYEPTNTDNTILLDKTSNYIVITFSQKVTNFKINEIEKDDDEYKDIDLLYSKKSLNDKVIIRKSIDYENPDIRISFKNEYDYTFSITPTYNNDKEVLEFKTKINQ